MGLLEALHQEREELESKLKKVAAMIEDYGGTVGKTAKKKGRVLSAAARKALSEGAKKRWAKVKAKAKKAVG